MSKADLGDNALEFGDSLHTLHDISHLLSQINLLTIVQSPIIHEEVFGLDLSQSIEDAFDAHISAGA